MPPAINLVGTRCTDQNHAALQRWYNDHAQLLMASPQLQSAELFRLQHSTASMDYLCLYHFAAISEFPAFDSGDVMANVRELSNIAPGRSSIEIVKRTQYERMLNRRWSMEQGGHIQASLLALREGGMQEVVRWLNDVLYTLHLQIPLQSAQVYAAKMGNTPERTELFVMLQSEQALPTDWHAWNSAYSARANTQAIWQTQAERIGQWLK